MRCDLTLNERVFLEKYLKYRNGTKAVLETYNIEGKDKNKIASTMASEILQKPKIQEYMNGFVSDQELVDLLKKGLNAFDIHNKRKEDWNTRLRCLELCFRIKGLLSNKDAATNVSYGKPQVKFIYNKLKTL